MSLECSHCQARYYIPSDVGDAILVCYQCGQGVDAQSRRDGESVEQTQCEEKQYVRTMHPWLILRWRSISSGFASSPWQCVHRFQPAANGIQNDEPSAEENSVPPSMYAATGETASVDARQAPTRKAAHIWPWLMAMLLLLAGSGFWVQKDAWLDNRWFRSTLINIGFDMSLRAKDWRIVPASVHPDWINREGGSRMLRIRGNIKNLLGSAMRPPRINIIFFSKMEPGKQIGSAVLNIILTPFDKHLSPAPYFIPARDIRPVPSLGNLNFTVVAQLVPEQIGDFTLAPAFY